MTNDDLKEIACIARDSNRKALENKHKIQLSFAIIISLIIGAYLGGSFHVAVIKEDVKTLKKQVYHTQNKQDQVLDYLELKYNPSKKYGTK